MKKTLLATLVLTGFVSAAQASVTVFKDDNNQVDLKGRVYAGYVNQENNDSETSNGESDTYFRFGFKTKSQLTDGLQGISRVELQWAAADGGKQSTTKTRLMFAGTQADWGTITFGRQYAADELVADWTDSGTSNMTGNEAINNFSRESNLLKFEGSYIDALTLGAHLQLEADQDGKDKSGYGVGVVYAFDFGLELGATYGLEAKDKDDTTTALLAAQYKVAGLTAALVYDMTSEELSEDDHTALEASVAYKFGKTTIVGRYLVRDVDALDDYDVERFTLGAAYKFNKKFRLVAEYIADQVEGEEDSMTFAARYDF